MLLEKIKQHGGKIMFFMMNLAIVSSGALLVNQNNVKKVNASIAENDAQKYKSVVDYALEAQQQIMEDKVTKINTISNNTDTLQRQQGVNVTKTIPAVTKTVTIQQPVGSSSSSKSSKSSSSSSKTTTPAKAATTTTKTS